MNLGSKLIFALILLLIFTQKLFSENTITSSPLINLEKIKPSFEEADTQNDSLITNNQIKNKKKRSEINSSHAVVIGLDKITAKSSEIIVNINETKSFGPLQIKILECGKVKNNNKIDDVAYMQVIDSSKSQNEQVFIFNGWTFASDPNLTPFDHAIYDLQLVSCFKA